MPTQFHFEHEFRAPSPAAVFAAYFENDRLSGITRRDHLEREDTAERLTTLTRAWPERQLPVYVRPFVSGPLHFMERMVWDRTRDRIDIDIHPSVMGKRTHIRVEYVLTQVRPGVVRRVYAGEVTVEIALVGGKAERMIIDDIGGVLATVVPCTQEWLDAHPRM
jgi:hypothetical protein